MLDSSILIAPLVFFITPNDPRFLNTVDRILLPPEKGGLTSAGLVYRYDTELSNDGKSPVFFSQAPPFQLSHTNISLSYRRRRARRCFQHVHVLACGSADARLGLRAGLPGACRQPVREHAQLLEPPVHVFRGDLA